MKTPRTLLLAFAFAFAAVGAHAAPGTISFDVVVKQKASKTAVFNGKTDARGNFATPELAPGSYAVEFRSKAAAAMKGRDITISLNSGKGQTSETTASADKFSSGVAMAFEVKRPTKVTGQVGASTGAEAVVNTKGALVPGTLKIVNGKRYVWMPPELGSNMGGKWVPEGSPGAPRANVSRGNRDTLQGMQDMGGQGSVPGP